MVPLTSVDVNLISRIFCKLLVFSNNKVTTIMILVMLLHHRLMPCVLDTGALGTANQSMVFIFKEDY